MASGPGARRSRARAGRARRVAALGREGFQHSCSLRRGAPPCCCCSCSGCGCRCGSAVRGFRAMLFNTALAARRHRRCLPGECGALPPRRVSGRQPRGRNTPPPQLESVLDGLRTDVSLFYFYNHSDANARKAKELLTVAARQNRHFQFHGSRPRQGAGEGARVRGSRLQHRAAAGRRPASCRREHRRSRADGLCGPAGPEDSKSMSSAS